MKLLALDVVFGGAVHEPRIVSLISSTDGEALDQRVIDTNLELVFVVDPADRVADGVSLHAQFEDVLPVQRERMAHG